MLSKINTRQTKLKEQGYFVSKKQISQIISNHQIKQKPQLSESVHSFTL